MKDNENVRNHRDLKLVVTEQRQKKLTSEPNYDSYRQFNNDLMVIEMGKTEVLMDKPIYLGQAILDISKTLIYEFWCVYLKPKYQDKVKLSYMGTDSYTLHIETNDFFEDIANDVDEWFDICKYDETNNRPLPIGENKKLIATFKNELNGKIMTAFIALREKTYTFVQINKEDESEEHKKAKGTKKCVIKKHLNFELYKTALFNNETTRCTQQSVKSDYHKIYTQSVYKIPLNNKDDKRIQSFDGITAYAIRIDINLINKSEQEIRQKPAQFYY